MKLLQVSKIFLDLLLQIFHLSFYLSHLRIHLSLANNKYVRGFLKFRITIILQLTFFIRGPPRTYYI